MQHDFNPYTDGATGPGVAKTLLDEFAGSIAAALTREWNPAGLPSIQISKKAYELAYELLVERQSMLKRIDEKLANGSL